MTKLRFEAWTLPTSADFKPLFDRPLPAVDGTGVVELSDYTDGTVTVPASWEGLKTWNGGWVRVYLGNKLIDEFLAERAPVDLQRPGTVTFSGPSVNGLVEKCAVYPYRYPDDAPGAQDWHWGLDENLLRNGDASENPDGIANAGFEDGTPEPWWAGAVAGVSANLAVKTDDPAEGIYHAEVAALLNEGGMSTSVKTYPGRLYTFGIKGKTASGTHKWQLGAAGEGVSAAPGAYMPPDGREEALKDHDFGDSDYDEVWMQFVAGPKQSSAQLNVRYFGGNPPQTLKVDEILWDGFGVGTDGWEASNGVADFRVMDDDPAPPDGFNQYFTVTAGQHHRVYQSVRRVIPGETMSYELLVRGPAAHTWTLEVRDLRGARIHQKSFTLNTSDWSTVTGTFQLPSELPGDGSVEFSLVNRHQGQSTVFFTGARLFSGLPKATATEIIRTLVEAAQDRGTFTFLDLDFSDTHDSANTELDPISLSVFFGAGANLSQPLAALKTMGYEWEIRALEVPAGGKTHELKLWGPASTIGDLTATPGGPSVLAGANVTEGSANTRIPGFTALLVHGQGSARLEDTDPSGEATYGRWERVVDAENITDETQLQLVADAKFAEEAANQLALSATVLATGQAVPLVAYRPGNTIWWQFPGVVAKQARKVRRVGWAHREVAEFNVQGSRTLTPSGGLAVAVQKLLREFRRRAAANRESFGSSAPIVVGGESFGAHIHLTAATQEITDAGGMVEWTVSSLHAPYNFPLAEGHVEWWAVSQRGYFDVAVAFKLDSYLGMAVEILRRRGGSVEMVWPFSSGMGEYEHGNEFAVVAGGIELQPGDEIGVKVTPGETTDVVSGSLMIQLVDRSVHVAAPEPEPGEWELVLETDPGRFGIVFDGTNWWLTVSATGASPALFKYDTSWNLVDSYSPFTGNRNYRGITYYPTDGYLYVSYDGSLSDSGHRVRRVDPSDGSTVTTGPAIGTEPFWDITVKDGDLYVRGRYANFDQAWIIDISTLERTGSVVCHEEIDGFEWDEGNECWWVAWKKLLDPVYKVYAFSEDFSTELVEIDAPERLRGVERQGDFLYAVGDSGVWRVKVV